MRRQIAALFAISALAAATPAYASEDGQVWTSATINFDLPADFKLSSETVARISDAKGFYEIEENLMIGHSVAKDVTFWLGYTHNPQYLQGDSIAMEHRFRQQVGLDKIAMIGKAKLSGRLRFEERWRDGISDTAFRFRPQVKLSIPLKGKTSLALSHESFLNLNTTRFQSQGGYDRMRNAIGFSFPLVGPVKAEIGYLNQYSFKRIAPDSSDHVATVSFSASF